MPCVIFIALQCCQCATMQVKQQKKSSNKWICVVCNQRQSVTKVFAQSLMAKDLRQFVQSFNMSRGKAVDEHQQQEIDPKMEDLIPDPVNRHPCRTDWSDYLDLPSPEKRNRSIAGDDEDDNIDIVTELPRDISKKPRLTEEGDELDKPLLLNKKNNQHGTSQAQTNNQQQAQVSSESRTGNDCFRRVGDDNTKTNSKWSSYLDEEEEHKNEDENSLFFEMQAIDEKVEDDVHDDFR